MNYNSIENQEIKKEFIDREVICNVSMMVFEVASKAECFPEYEDELLDAFRSNPDYEVAAKDFINTEMRTREATEYIDCNYEFRTGNAKEQLVEILENNEEFESFCEDLNIEPYETEIYEHWVVTEWFADKLENHGEKVFELFNMTIWGRGCTGQAILLDGVISEITDELGLLLKNKKTA